MPDEVMRFPSDKIIVKLSGRNPVKSDKIVYFQEEQYKNLVKIPYVYSESCYDETRQYIKLTPEQKKKFKDYPYNYVPYPEALKTMKDDIQAKKNLVASVSKEQEEMMDKADRDRHNMTKRNLKKQIEGFKLYAKIFKALEKEDERIAAIMKKLRKEAAEEKADKVSQKMDNADKIIIAKKNVSVEDAFEEIKRNSISASDTGFISSVKIETPQEMAKLEQEADKTETVENEQEVNEENVAVDDKIDENVSDDDILTMLDNSDATALANEVEAEQNKSKNSDNENSPFGVSSSDDEEQEDDEDDFSTQLDNL